MLKELQSRLEGWRTKAAGSGPCSDVAVFSSARCPPAEGWPVLQELLESHRLVDDEMVSPKKKKVRAKKGASGAKPGKAPALKAQVKDVKALTDGEGKMYCWFFHKTPSCKRGKDCPYSHQMPKEDILDALTPPRARSSLSITEGTDKR